MPIPLSSKEAAKPDATFCKFTVPLVPISVNHYKKPRRGGRGFYVTDEARSFKSAVAIFAKEHPRSPDSAQFSVQIHVYLGSGAKGDIDNFAKVTLDALVEAGVLRSDAAVSELIMRKFRDRENPRTEIEVTVLG